MSNPRITVVIPTLNRALTLEAALRTVATQDYDELEIIVSDNCSDDHTRDIIHSFNDPRLRYIRPERRLGMSQHWEFALSHVKEGWVTIIGDDDGLLPGALMAVARVIRETSFSFIDSSYCKYIWPEYKGNTYGHIVGLKPRKGMLIKNTVNLCSSFIMTESPEDCLPILYTGRFANMLLIREIVKKHGKFYHSQIPDIFSGVLFSTIMRKYIKINIPLGLSGRSKFSYGAALDKSYKGIWEKAIEKRKEDFLAPDPIPLHPDIPQAPGGGIPMVMPIIMYESLLQVIEMGLLPESCRNREHFVRDLIAYLDRTAHEVARHRTMEWLKTFSRMHDLDTENLFSRRTKKRQNPIQKVIHFIQKRIQKTRKMHIRGTPKTPLKNVYEASLAMGQRLKNDYRALM